MGPQRASFGFRGASDLVDDAPCGDVGAARSLVLTCRLVQASLV